MAKTIKFNLICDEKPIRTIEALRENFSIEDMLEYYSNGLLQRWLQVRGFDEEHEKVKKIKTEDSLEIVKELIRIFGIEADDNKVKEGVYMLKYLADRELECAEHAKKKFKTKNIIDDYQNGYNQLVAEIRENPYNLALIKNNIKALMNDYRWIMDLNHRELFWRGFSWLAIICLLMHEEARKYYLPLPIEGDDEGGTGTKLDTEFDSDKRDMYDSICRFTKEIIQDETKRQETFGDYIKVIGGTTESYWKDNVPKDKKCMIISMGRNDHVRSNGVSEMDLKCEDVSAKFVILDGINYMSNDQSSVLLYMEV